MRKRNNRVKRITNKRKAMSNEYNTSQHNMTILLYHNLIKDNQVREDIWERSDEGAPCLYYRSERSFKGDMWGLGSQKIDYVGQGETAVTFDDAKESVYKIAFPILKEYNYKFSVFAPTDLVGKKKYCSWEQLKEMSILGNIESHGHSHKVFTELSREELVKELKESYRLIKENIGREPLWVSCPGSRRINKKIVQECGFRDIRYNLGEIKVMKNI